MSHTIFVNNKSNQDQVFEVHGWNNNQNITVVPHSTTTINAPDGTSGAIIALHDGHEGEQAEITKNGFMGNDFIDLSNIMGAGGNLTVMQVGDRSTLKGDPNFMQDSNRAWHDASQDIRNGLSDCVHLDVAGNVTRIDAIKNYPRLEDFVRSFANNMTYIGIGAWAGNPGHPSDNAQSSAAHGNKDILVTYNDGNANPDDSNFTFAAVKNLRSASKNVGTSVDELKASNDDGSPGIILCNKSNQTSTYYFYNNYWNGNGTAGANFDKPEPVVQLSAGETRFVSLPTTFKGRVQRGTQIPCTWAEFQIEADNDHAAHGDISVEQGNDGGAWIRSTDGRDSAAGFSDSDISGWGAPEAYQIRADGVRALASTMGNWLGGPNQAAINCQQGRIGKTVYVTGGSGIPDVASSNRRLTVEFY